MTERWQRELQRLGNVEMPASVLPRAAAGPHHAGAEGMDREPRARQRVVAAVVAFVVFVASGTLAWLALRPEATSVGHESGRPTLSLRIAPGSPSIEGISVPELFIRYGTVSLGFPPRSVVNQAGNPPSFGGIHDPSGLPEIGPGFAPASPVRLVDIPANASVEMLRAAEFPSPSDWSLAKTGRLPGLGSYVLEIVAPAGSVWARWDLLMDVIRSGTVQFWRRPPSASATGPEASLHYQMIVSGATRSAGMHDGSTRSGSPLPDALPRVASALTVRQGVGLRLVGFDAPSVSYSRIGSPLGSGGLIVMTNPYPTLNLTPGAYYLLLPVLSPSFSGDLVFAVRVVASSAGSVSTSPPTVTASPSGSHVLVVNCDSGTRVSSRVVEAQRGGVHVTLAGSAPSGERIGFLPSTGGKPYVTVSGISLAKGSANPLEPGAYDVRCLPSGVFKANKVPPGPHVTVVDPNHYWRSPNLDCQASDQVRIKPALAPKGAVTEDDVIRAIVPGVLPTDTIDIAGYLQRYEGLGHRVVRDGDVLAIVFMGEAMDVAGGKECTQILQP